MPKSAKAKAVKRACQRTAQKLKRAELEIEKLRQESRISSTPHIETTDKFLVASSGNSDNVSISPVASIDTIGSILDSLPPVDQVDSSISAKAEDIDSTADKLFCNPVVEEKISVTFEADPVHPPDLSAAELNSQRQQEKFVTTHVSPAVNKMFDILQDSIMNPTDTV